jgi:hypothetical protein
VPKASPPAASVVSPVSAVSPDVAPKTTSEEGSSKAPGVASEQKKTRKDGKLRDGSGASPPAAAAKSGKTGGGTQ